MRLRPALITAALLTTALATSQAAPGATDAARSGSFAASAGLAVQEADTSPVPSIDAEATGPAWSGALAAPGAAAAARGAAGNRLPLPDMGQSLLMALGGAGLVAGLLLRRRARC